MNAEEAFDKLHHTLILNVNNINNNHDGLQFNIDTDYHVDCINFDEMIDCLDTLESVLQELKQITKSRDLTKALKALESLANFTDINDYGDDERYTIIKQTLIKFDFLQDYFKEDESE